MIWSFLLASLLAITPCLSFVSQGIMGWGLGREGGRWGPSLLEALYLFISTIVCFLLSLCLLSSLNISLPLASKSNLNTETCSLVILMCSFGPDGAGYAGRILMEGGYDPVPGVWRIENAELGSGLHSIQKMEILSVKPVQNFNILQVNHLCYFTAVLIFMKLVEYAW